MRQETPKKLFVIFNRQGQIANVPARRTLAEARALVGERRRNGYKGDRIVSFSRWAKPAQVADVEPYEGDPVRDVKAPKRKAKRPAQAKPALKQKAKRPAKAKPALKQKAKRPAKAKATKRAPEKAAEQDAAATT